MASFKGMLKKSSMLVLSQKTFYLARSLISPFLCRSSSTVLSGFQRNNLIFASRKASTRLFPAVFSGHRPDFLPPPSLKERTMATLATADVFDSNISLSATGEVRVLQTVFQIYGQLRTFSGPVETVKVFEDNILVREMIESKGEKKVLVIDGGGSMRSALIGGKLAQLAHDNGWIGIILNGCVRDVDDINASEIGVRALGSTPVKPGKKGHGEKHVPVDIGGTVIREGDWLYADSDGVLVSTTKLSIKPEIL